MGNSADNPDREAMCESAGSRLTLIAESFQRLTGRPLVDGSLPLEQALWEAPQVIVAHGTETRPLFFYGNRAALVLFEMHASEFIGLPSDRSAEPAAREARAKMLAALERDRVVEGYSGVRVTSSSRRFRIAGATVWDLLDAAGERHGQAATFAEWQHLDQGSSDRSMTA
jgi:hypothetical protein